MATVRGEFIILGGGASAYAANIIKDVVGTFTAESGDTVDIPNDKPDGTVYVRLTAIGGSSFVAWGANPTASGELPAHELRLVDGLPEAISVTGGWKLSFLDGD